MVETRENMKNWHVNVGDVYFHVLRESRCKVRLDDIVGIYMGMAHFIHLQ